jgi:hypothetical protein
MNEKCRGTVPLDLFVCTNVHKRPVHIMVQSNNSEDENKKNVLNKEGVRRHSYSRMFKY